MSRSQNNPWPDCDHRKFDQDQASDIFLTDTDFISVPAVQAINASIKDCLLVAGCVSTILSQTSVTVTRQRHHGSTAGECEDEEECCDEALHNSPLLRETLWSRSSYQA
jgi:hypothetical protein